MGNPRPEDSAACIPNLGPKQKRQRLWLGILVFIATAAMAVVLVSQKAPLVSRLLLFFPFYLSMIGFLQAKERICVIFAGRGIQDYGAGPEPVSDNAIKNLRKRAAAQILARALLLALSLTLFIVFMK